MTNCVTNINFCWINVLKPWEGQVEQALFSRGKLEKKNPPASEQHHWFCDIKIHQLPSFPTQYCCIKADLSEALSATMSYYVFICAIQLSLLMPVTVRKHAQGMTHMPALIYTRQWLRPECTLWSIMPSQSILLCVCHRWLVYLQNIFHGVPGTARAVRSACFSVPFDKNKWLLPHAIMLYTRR